MQISVVGHSHASLPPERATLQMRLGVEGTDKQAALEHTSSLVKSFTNVVDQLRALTPSPITWFAVAPIGTRSWRPWTDNGTTLPLRHAAECVVKLKFHDFGALSRFIDQWGGRSGVTIDGVEWTLTEARQKAEEDNVLSQAVVQAHARATTMARAAGERGVKFLELADRGLLDDTAGTYDHGVHAMSMRSGISDESEAVTVAPEDVELDVTIHARFTTD